MSKKVHFVDAGANIGQSIKWALKTYDIGRIDSFEPLPKNVSIIQEDADIPWDIVTLHEKAVWTVNETRVFYSQYWGARTGSSLIEGKTTLDGRMMPIDVECIDFAEWIKINMSTENYNILKIDIEGAEYSVIPYLIGAGISDLIDEWLIEFHGKKVSTYNRSVEKYVKENLKWTDWGAHPV